MRSKLLVLVTILMFVNLIGAGTSPAAAAPGATILSISLNDCFIDITFQVEDAGFYAVNVWDDGNFRGGAGAQFDAGQIGTARYLIGDPILNGALGIGLYVEDAVGTSATTTYASNGSYEVPATIGDACAALYDSGVTLLVAGCDAFIPITADSAVGTFVTNAETYSSPGNLTNPLVVLEAGKSAWVIGVDATSEYYKVVWSCSLLWVKTDTIGPNYDAVWQGHPLPSTVVN